MTLFLVGLATFAATYLGGILALRWKDKLHLVLGFSSGAVIGVAFFDLLPESLELASTHYEIPVITATIAAGFLGFMFLNRVFLLHPHTED